MPPTQGASNALKTDLWNGVHQPGDTYMVALYTSASTISASTAAYTTSGEVSGTGYTAGGRALTGRTVALTGSTGYLSFDDPAWPNATITARGALIYNATRANAALCVLDFGADVSSTNGTFLVDLPAAGASAVLRIT